MTDSNAEHASAHSASTTDTARLRRRATDRVAAGVASGLADYLNVDPLLIRVIFVGLVLLNGAGFFIYLAAWLFIPVEGREVSIVEGGIRRLGVHAGAAGTVAWVVIGIFATLLLFDWLRPEGGRLGVDPAFLLALIVIGGGILLVRRNAAEDAPTLSEAATMGESTATAPPAASPVVRRTRVRRERSPLGLYVSGALLVVIGTLAAIDGATAVDLLPAHYAGSALAILGVGLVVGAWRGHARWLILIGLLLVPVALALSFVTVPLDGGWGERRVEPASAAELRDEYRLAGGRLTLDLTDLPPSTGERHIAADLGIGRLLVILPEGARADIATEIGAGEYDVLGARAEGTRLADREVSDGDGGPLVLDLEVGIGSVLVRTAATGE